MNKIEREYDEKYGNVPASYDKRIETMLGHNSYSRYKGFIFEKIHHILNIKWKTVRLVIYLVPKATPRPRYSGTSKIFYVKDASNNRSRFKKFMDKEKLDHIITPMKFYCVSYFPIPSNMNKLEKLMAELGLIRPISKPDWDNIGKTYSDMVQEQLILDDSLIVEGVSKKFYSSKPRVEITIEYMEEFDSEYNMKKILK